MTEGLYRETITRRCIDRLEAAGVKMVNHRDALRSSSFGAVLHWKVWIRDGEELIIGGQNVGNYENSSDGFNFLDRDNDVLVRGPSVTDAETAWLDAWDARGGAGGTSAVRAAADAAKAKQEREHLRGAANYAHWLGDPATRMDGNCRVMMQGVHATPNAIAPVVQRYLDGSQRQVVFSSPTVRYDYKESINTRNTGLAVHQLMRSLREDLRSGRNVVVLTNGVGGGMGESQTWLRARRDHALRREQWAFYGLLRQFNELVARRSAVANRAVTVPLAENPNVEVWTYFQYIHTKIWLFDRIAAMVGSWNLDENSTDLNPEAAILCLDRPLRDAVVQDLTLALVNSVPETSAATGSADVANVQNY
jgi:phosphatidylserine/phosphatidylglycerophosphate/cardiolipin synthase-like enzyme